MKKFVVYTNDTSPVKVTLNDIFKGYAEPGDSVVIKTYTNPPIIIEGENENLHGKLYYKPAPRNEEVSLTIDKTTGDINEISKRHEYDYNGKFELYNIGIGYFGAGGYLKLTSNEENVEVYLDFNKLGTIYNESFNKRVPAGEHILMVRKDFFRPITRILDVQPNEIYPINFILKEVDGWEEESPVQVTTTQARGNLTIGTERSDYIIEIEGVKKEAPFELKNMPAGVYELRITCDDFSKYLEVTIPVDSTSFVDLDQVYRR